VEGLGYLTKQDIVSAAVVEQQPMFRDASTRALGVLLLGSLAWFLPALPLALAWLAWRERTAALGLVAAWNAVLSALAASQLRYANDLAPTAALGLALVASRLGSAAASRLRAPRAAGAALAVALAGLALAPTLPRHHLPALRRALTASPAERLASPEATVVRFARGVRAATPETSGFADPDVQPEYALLCDPSLGHALHYEGRRPTLSDNFGPWVGEAAFVRSVQLLLGVPTDETAASLRALRARYVVTNWQPAYHEGGLLQRLHEFDGRAHDGRAALAHYRLVLEGPADGQPLAALVGALPPPGSVPYKLFEVVEGAVLDVAAPPGTLASASAMVATPVGRRFAHRVRAQADADGRARLRVPYATRCADPVCPTGPYRVEAGGVPREVDVELADVREGRALRVD
jgi:hypothetical protein